MTTHRTYSCDLCSDKIKPTSFAVKDGFGIYFGNNGKFVFKGVTDTEHHVCHQCAKSVHEEFRKVTPVEKSDTS